MKKPKEKPKDGAAQSMIRKLTTEKAIKSQKVISADEITEIKLSSRGMKSIESLDLPSLRRLDLSKNQLNRLKGLQGCSQVTYLTAAGNELTGEGLDGVRPLRDLKVFNISSNRVRRIPPSVFANFRQLQALVMNNNEITEVPPSWLKKGLLSLNTLVLSHNKLKSLSASGLGRLTGLTKLSVSHNMLLELPDLSSCNGLEELRAAHNRISQVPASLAGNVALRTLDLGHNDINDWIGLESAGKTLTVLVQLTLAGNPVCGDRFSGAVSAEGEGEDAEAEVQGGEEYITKVRSLFPSLKVRDGKRVLMKKSHTFYQQRASGSDASSSLTTPPSLLPQQKRNRSLAARAKNSKPGRASVPDTEAGGGSYEADGGALKRKDVSNPNRKDYTECDQESRGGSSEKNVETGKAGRRLKKVSGAVGKEVNDKVESGNEAAPRSKRVDSGGRGKSGGQDKVRTSSRSKAKKHSKRGEESASELSTGIPHSDTTPERKSEEAVVLVSEGRRTDESDGKKSVQERPPKRPKIAGEKKEPSAEAADGGRHEDPYSSSEELPIPGGGTVQSKALVAAKGVGGGANRAISPAGASDSGVKEVVLHRKRKGSKMKISKKIAARGGASNQESEGNAADFSVDAMLQARGLRETLGLGSGMSAWD